MQRVRIPSFFLPMVSPQFWVLRVGCGEGGGTDAASLGYGLSEAHWTDPVFLAP